LAQGLQFGAQMRSREEEQKREDERIKAREKAETNKQILDFTGDTLKLIEGGASSDIIGARLDVLYKQYGLDPKGDLAGTISDFAMSVDEDARARGRQMLTIAALQPDQVLAFEEMFESSPVKAAQLLEQRINEIFKIDRSGGDAVPGQLFSAIEPGTGGGPPTQRVQQVIKTPEGPKVVGQGVNLGAVREPPAPPTLTAYVDKNGRTIITQGQPGEFGLALSNVEAREFREQQAAFEGAVVLRNAISDRLTQAKNPDALLGIVGTSSRFINSVVRQAQAAASLAGVDIGSDDALLKGDYDLSGFNSNAVRSAQARANIISLAYAIARTRQPGGQLSNVEVQQSLDTMAASSGSAEQMMAAIDEVLVNSHETLRARARGLQLPEPNLLGDIGKKEQLPDAAKSQLKEGFETRFNNGQVWTLQGGNPVRVR
jgi:hypothetical protein